MKSKSRFASLVTLASVLGASSAAAQTTYRVPADFVDVQSAISATIRGDTVLVSPGTYFGAIDFLGKDIHVVSVSGPGQTVLDGMMLDTVVRFETGETRAAILEGFTVTHGAGSLSGAVYCYGASPTITGCVFIDNEGGPGMPGAVYCRSDSALAITDCHFESNLGGSFSDNSDYAGPGVIEVSGQSSATIERCTFVGNRGGSAGQRGGAGALESRSLSWIAVRNCVFDANIGGDGTGGCCVDGGAGAIHSGGNPFGRVEGCVFTGNRGGNGATGDGGAGAIDLRGSCFCTPAGMEIVDCRFTANRGGLGGDLGGPGALRMDNGADPAVSSCTFRGNVGGDCRGQGAQAGPGVASCSSSSSPTFIRCDMLENHGGNGSEYREEQGGSGVLFARGDAHLEGCLLEGNRGGLGGDGRSDQGGPGAVFHDSGNGFLVMLNCVVAKNVGGSPGTSPSGGFDAGDISGVGAVAISGGEFRATSCTFVLNQGGPATPAGTVAGALALENDSRVINSIIWGNIGANGMRAITGGTQYTAVRYCCLSESWTYPQPGNVVADPMLADVSAGDYHLRCDSPCIDVGHQYTPLLPDEDYDQEPRTFGALTDIGADELTLAFIGSNYCFGAPNSTGAGSSMAAYGRDSVAASCLTLTADSIPGSPGLFFYGPTQVQTAFGDGFRCAGGTLLRLPPSPSQNGVLTRTVDLTTGPITANSTWNFQAWYRDLAAGGTGFNLSDGIQVTFTD